MSKCQFCTTEKKEAFYAMQFIASDKPTFSRLGSHVRGFSVYKVCDTHYNEFNGHTFDEIKNMVKS